MTTTPSDVRHSSGYPSIDRLLGGGLRPATSVLLSGGAGVGKSTLLAQILCAVAADGGRALALFSEEPVEVGGQRLLRLAALPARLRIDVVATQRLPDALLAVERNRPNVVGVDSIGLLRNPSAPWLTPTLDHMVAVAGDLRAMADTRAGASSAPSSRAPVVIATAHTNAGWVPGDPADPGIARVGEAMHAHLHMTRDGADVVVTCLRSELGPVGASARFAFVGRMLVERDAPPLSPWPDLAGDR